MKIKTISRTAEDFERKTKLDITKVHRNRDPVLHPFDRAREYTKAVMAVKLDKIFAKPFVGALNGHSDGVFCATTVRDKVVPFISGACDGEIRIWDLAQRKCVWSAIAHTGFVRGVAADHTGSSFLTCGDDKSVKRWALDSVFGETVGSRSVDPISTIMAPGSLTCIDHHWVDSQFATGGDVVSLWDTTRSTPIHTYQWGADSILSVRFNPAESCLVGSTASDRAVCLYDLRAAVPMRKFVMPMKSNRLAWNPREPFNFVLANEDHNLYSFDMRKLDKALMIHKDHVSAVMDVAFSPTGREFASAGYDRTIRLFNINQGRSRDVYHTKRMQRVFCVNFSADAQYVLSGSDDTNIRIWKCEASKSVGVEKARESRKKQYLTTVKKRFSHMPEVKRIINDHKVPKAIKKAKAISHIQRTSAIRKLENRKKHSKASDVVVERDRNRAVLKELE